MPLVTELRLRRRTSVKRCSAGWRRRPTARQILPFRLRSSGAMPMYGEPTSGGLWLMLASSSLLQGQSPAVLLAAVQSLVHMSDLGGAKVQAERAVALAEAIGDRVMHARAMTELTIVLHSRNEAAEGMVCALRAIELCDMVGDLATSAKAHAVAAR